MRTAAAATAIMMMICSNMNLVQHLQLLIRRSFEGFCKDANMLCREATASSNHVRSLLYPVRGPECEGVRVNRLLHFPIGGGPMTVIGVCKDEPMVYKACINN